MNYVNKANSKTKRLHTFTSREALVKTFCQKAKLAEKIRAVRKAKTEEKKRNLKSSLPAVLFQGKLDEELFSVYQNRCEQEMIPKSQRKGPRSTCFLRPTGLFMMDFDRDTDSTKALYKRFLTAMKSEGIDYKEVLAMAHRTVGGYGLRLVLKRRIGHTIEEDQQWIATLMGEPHDKVCKDLARLSFMVSGQDILYVNPDMLLDDTLGHPFVNDELWQPHQPLPLDGKSNKTGGYKKKSTTATLPGTRKAAKTLCNPTYEQHHRQYPTITHIDEESLIHELISRTERYRKEPIREGNRNRSYLDMALSLMGLLNDQELTIHLLIKASTTYGHNLEEEEIRHVTHNATRYAAAPKAFVPYYLCKHINNGLYYIGRG